MASPADERNPTLHSDQPEDSTPEALRESLQDYAVIGLDPSGRIVQWSDGACATFGFSSDEALGQPIRLIFTPEDQAAEAHIKELERSARDGKSEDERWHVRRDGKRLWVSGIVRSLRGESGELAGFTKIARDITTQKLAALQRDAQLAVEQAARIEAERAHAEAERRWRNLEEISENIPAMIGMIRLPGLECVFANRALRETAGRDLVGRSFAEAGLGPELLESILSVSATGKPNLATVPAPAAQGDAGERHYEIMCQPMANDGHGPGAVLFFALDVSDRTRNRRRLERLTRELAEERDRLRAEIAERRRAEEIAEQRSATLEEHAALLDLARDGIFALRMDGTIEVWNRGAEEMYGWPRDRVIGRGVHDLLKTGFPRPLSEIEKTLISEGHWEGELKHTRADGSPVDVSTRWVLRKRNGVPFGWLEINRDITERNRMEAHLRDAQKLESLGLLAGGIAHDFNNLLTGIIGNASLAADMVAPDSSVRPILDNVVAASDRAAFLTRQMLAYAGKGQFFIEAVDLSAAVRDALALIGSSIPKHVSVKLALASRLPCIQVDATQLQQIAMNLILNAAEAIPEGRRGEVSVRTQLEELDEAAAAGHFDVGQPQPGRHLLLEVTDNGAGIEPRDRAKIFDPFFTTKFTGRGLGLAAVSGIIRALHAAVRIESAPGRGTTFRVLFPAGDGKLSNQANSSPAGRPIVLVVDDEPVIRQTAEAILAQRGYAVRLAANGPEAIEVFKELHDRLSLVLLDVTMPGMGGEEVFRHLKAIRADVPVVVSSGFNEQDAIRRFGGLGVAGFVQKPYTVKKLTEQVSAVLGST